jgi:putative nucleotidyltransferase with HDIG domain
VVNRILFVDDEPMVLDALRNALRSKRKEWDMVFKNGGAAALLELERGPVDVIVSDMRMPEMDGAEFLSKASKLCPGATRIVLSGHMEESSLARAAITAHRYLTKPCSNDLLSSSISRSLELRALFGNEHIRASVGGIESLPTVPSVYRALGDALLSERASPEQIAKIVEQDVGIGAKVLQLVNSAFFGLPRKTTSLLQAVRYLGLGTIRSLVLSYSVFEQLGQENLALAEEGHDHALRCARIARLLLNGKPEAELAFTAGLLHDVGSLVLASRMPQQYAEIREHAEVAGVPIHEVERERLGVSHAQVGAYLLGLWGLPHEVLDIVALHHAPWVPSLPLDASSAVRVAEAIALELTSDRRFALAHTQPLPDGWIEQTGVASAIAAARAEEKT